MTTHGSISWLSTLNLKFHPPFPVSAEANQHLECLIRNFEATWLHTYLAKQERKKFFVPFPVYSFAVFLVGTREPRQELPLYWWAQMAANQNRVFVKSDSEPTAMSNGSL